MSISEMISLHPDVGETLSEPMMRALRHAMFCGAACTSCADSCVAEDDVAMMRQCIRECLDCAEVCDMTVRLAIRRTGSNEALTAAALGLCTETCERCATECAKHDHAHCQRCAEMCRDCAADCRKALASLG